MQGRACHHAGIAADLSGGIDAARAHRRLELGLEPFLSRCEPIATRRHGRLFRRGAGHDVGRRRGLGEESEPKRGFSHARESHPIRPLDTAPTIRRKNVGHGAWVERSARHRWTSKGRKRGSLIVSGLGDAPHVALHEDLSEDLAAAFRLEPEVSVAIVTRTGGAGAS